MVYILLFYVLYIRIVFFYDVITLLLLCFLIPLPSSDFSKYYFFPSIQTELLLQFYFLWSIISDTKAEIITAKKVSYFIHTLFFVSIRVKRLPFITSFFMKKISLSLFPCTPPSRCKRWSLSILNFCPSPICYFSFIFAYTPKRRLLPHVFLFTFFCNRTPQFRGFYCTISPAYPSQQ